MDKTINEMFENRVERFKDRLAVEKKRNGTWETATWNQYYERARAVGLGLHSLGIRKGDRISILSENRLEWLYSDIGGLGVGACVIPIYASLVSHEVEHYVENSDSKLIIVEDGVQLKKAFHVKKKCPKLEKIVVLDEEDINVESPFIISFKELSELGRKKHEEDSTLYDKLSKSVQPQDMATFVYTSGTTGVPKGAVFTHGNVMAALHSLGQIDPPFAVDTDKTSAFLPTSHIFGRITDHYSCMYVGATTSYVEKIDTLLDDIQEIKPTIIMAFPRVCEKAYVKILTRVKDQPKPAQMLFEWALKNGEKVSELREAKKKIPPFLNLKYKIAYNLVFRKLKDVLGGQVRFMLAAGGPTAREIQLFFNAAGIMVMEGYGMTELCGPGAVSNLADYRIGTVGRPIPGLDMKIADDGEILVKGPSLFSHYWKMEEETKEAFTEDGYFMTGDVGSFDKAGFLSITDRKKDLIITAGGKNVAPQKIENLFKGDPLFSMFSVVGDKRKYLTALCNIDLEQAERFAKEKGIPFNDPKELLENEEFQRVIDDHVTERNKKLARFETIKYVKVIKNEFSLETGELTASLKVKRKVVHEKYKNEIDLMYK